MSALFHAAIAAEFLVIRKALILADIRELRALVAALE